MSEEITLIKARMESLCPAARNGLARLWSRCLARLGVAFLALGLWCSAAAAQELTPRAYWPAPNGTKVVSFGYQYSSGDIITDPSLPITGVDSRISYLHISYVQVFSLFGRTANLQLNLPYTRGTTKGIAEGEFRSRYISGIADARVRVSTNLVGAPTMDLAGFQALRAEPRTIIGASLLIQAPTGGYEPDRVINLGTNRWSVKPALGFIWPVHPTWLVEVELGCWFFTDNDDFLGVTRKQDPILSTEFHLVKRIRPGFWAALDVNYYTGGRTTVNHTERADLQRNSRVGGTLLFPFKRRHAIRGSYSTGVVTESGGDFEMYALSYQYVWQ
jgi:hypothetical protein